MKGVRAFGRSVLGILRFRTDTASGDPYRAAKLRAAWTTFARSGSPWPQFADTIVILAAITLVFIRFGVRALDRQSSPGYDSEKSALCLGLWTRVRSTGHS